MYVPIALISISQVRTSQDSVLRPITDDASVNLPTPTATPTPVLPTRAVTTTTTTITILDHHTPEATVTLGTVAIRTETARDHSSAAMTSIMEGRPVPIPSTITMDKELYFS